MQADCRSTRREMWLSRLAWFVWAINVTLLVLQLLVWNLPPAFLPRLSIAEVSVWASSLAGATMAALVASRRPRSPIGWWLGVLALGLAGSVFTEQYATYALVRNPGGLPAGDFVLWLAPAAILPIAIATIHLLALFPSGRLLSNRWKPVMWLAVGGIVFYWIEGVVTPGPLSGTNHNHAAPNKNHFSCCRSTRRAFRSRYRARYDASRTLERFTGQVRDEVNLGQLRSSLIAIARDAACTRIAVAPPIGSRSHAARETR